MARWVECRLYEEGRQSIWINLDQAVTIRGSANGTVITCAVADVPGALQVVVSDAPETILERGGSGNT